MRSENTVELINHTGGDRTHALEAWASTGTELNKEAEDKAAMKKAQGNCQGILDNSEEMF